jgi:hypothetical protein
MFVSGQSIPLVGYKISRVYFGQRVKKINYFNPEDTGFLVAWRYRPELAAGKSGKR